MTTSVLPPSVDVAGSASVALIPGVVVGVVLAVVLVVVVVAIVLAVCLVQWKRKNYNLNNKRIYKDPPDAYSGECYKTCLCSDCIALVWLTQLRIKRISLPFDAPSIVLSAAHNSGSMGMTLTSNPIVVTQGEVNHDAVNSGKEASTGGLYIYDYVRSTDIDSVMTERGPSALDYDTISDTPPVKVSIVYIRLMTYAVWPMV